MKRALYACLVLLAVRPFASAQPSTSAQNDAREFWLVRSQTLTSDLIKDAADLSPMQHAVLWVKLAQRWWREDQRRSRTWIAVTLVQPRAKLRLSLLAATLQRLRNAAHN